MNDESRVEPGELPLQERHRILDQVLQYRLNRRGWRLEFYSETSAVIVHGRPIDHPLHGLLTLISGGLWLIVWLLAIAGGGEKREMIYVHPSGHPDVRRLQ